MRLIDETPLENFGGWAGARGTLATMTSKQIQALEAELEELYPDGIETTALNDILWFEKDWIAELVGFHCWEDLEKENENED